MKLSVRDLFIMKVFRMLFYRHQSILSTPTLAIYFILGMAATAAMDFTPLPLPHLLHVLESPSFANNFIIFTAAAQVFLHSLGQVCRSFICMNTMFLHACPAPICINRHSKASFHNHFVFGRRTTNRAAKILLVHHNLLFHYNTTPRIFVFNHAKGKEKEEGKDCLLGMEARKGARGKSPAPSFAMRFPVDSVVQLFRRSANPARRVA